MNLRIIFLVLITFSLCSYAETPQTASQAALAKLNAKKAARATMMPGSFEPLPGIKMLNDAIVGIVELAKSTTLKVTITAFSVIPAYKAFLYSEDQYQTAALGDNRWRILQASALAMPALLASIFYFEML